MKLFDILDGKVVMNPQALAMPEFKTIWDRDDSEEKDQAYREISYVVYLCDESSNNPYRAYRIEDRDKVLKQDFMGGSKWKADGDILKAVKKHKEATQTTNSRLLRSAKNASEKLSEYFDTVDFSELDKDGKPVFSSRELAANLKEVGGIVKSLGILEDLVKKEQSESIVRGGGEIGFYETPREDVDYGD
ncbi:MAG: hypothetical protein ACTSQF_01905 [Candidatus Heimdallarchaeaceae archaeon]